MNLILFDNTNIRENLLPFTFTRPVADIRIGILSIREKWEKRMGGPSSTYTEEYLQEKFPRMYNPVADNIWINGSVCPNDELVGEIKSLKAREALYKEDMMIALNAGNVDYAGLEKDKSDWGKGIARLVSSSSFIRIVNTWDLFKYNAQAIREDYDFLTRGRKSQLLSRTNTVLGKEVFVEEGAVVECAILNAEGGPIYIGKDAEVMEGSLIRGPFALCEHSTLKMGTKIYGGTTIGPYCKAGGEVSNSILFGYSNKGHDGFLGNSVLGEWCNLGADTNNSNLKNNYGEVKLYQYKGKAMAGTGLQFCGLMMGDHSKSGINTMFNTGTVVGVYANVFGGGFPPTFIPDFSWGTGPGAETYKPAKAKEVAARVFERRGLVFDDIEKRILDHVFELTKDLRKV
jgi:UDP-N-acetylglucosamine diphosphorylase/glucosamine-1-phosphate N-acetyltransferase